MNARMARWKREGRELTAFLRSTDIHLLPIVETLRTYRADRLGGDLRAGVNVALLAFPQGMAYAWIAGLPIQYGIYGSAVAGIVGSFFTRTPFVMLGPTNATSVLLLSLFTVMGTTQAQNAELLPLLMLLVGFFLIVGAFLNVANIIQYISRSVITGYITAAALLIAMNQARNVLGVSFDTPAVTFFALSRSTLEALPSARPGAVLESLVTLATFLLLKRRFPLLPNVAITLVFTSALAAVLSRHYPMAFLAGVDAGQWSLTAPVLSLDAMGRLAGPALAIALLCALEGLSIGKSLAARAGARLNANQELYGMGLSNIACGLLSGVPASGSLTRSALNHASGATTPVAALLSGLFCAGGAFAFGPLLAYVPQSALATLVIAIGVSLIDPRQIRIVTRSTRSDATVFYTTLVAGLIAPLDAAIYLGAATSIILFLRKAAMPQMVEYRFTADGQLAELGVGQSRPDPEVSIVHVEGSLFFGAADLFRDQIRRMCEDENLRVIILKTRNAHHLDATSVMALEELVRYSREKERTLLFSEMRPTTIRIFQRSGLLGVIDPENVFEDVPENPTTSTARAVRRAQQIIGDREARVSIYAAAAPPAQV